MKIIHELNQLDFGGAERVVRNIIKFDKENQHTILSYKDGKFRASLEEAGANVIVLNEEDNLDLEADIIHIHSGGGQSRMARELSHMIPVVETIHSPIRSANMNEYVYARVGVSRIVSQLNRECMTIHNGLDFDELEPTKIKEEIKQGLGIPEGIPVIGRLGRIGRDKGLEEWILTCKELQDQGCNFIPLIVGGEARDCKGYVGKLKLMAESLPVKGIIWTGPKYDISNYLQVMDIFLYPSPTEGFGLVFIEALWNECIVVTCDNEVNREVVGGYSILAENNPKDLASGVKRVLDNPQLKDTLLGIQIEHAKQFNAETMSGEYHNLYKQVVDSIPKEEK